MSYIFQTREEFIYARRVEPVAKLATVMKSNSYTGLRHEYGEKLENASLGYVEKKTWTDLTGDLHISYIFQ